jgi:aminoglycoside phosphotransferase (APT) family kinase protein
MRFDHPLADEVVDVVRQGFPDATVTGIRPLEGGHSGQTLLVELDGGPVPNAVAKSGALGRPAVGRHDVLRQARLLQALEDKPGVHVPRVLATGAGEPALFLMSFAPGDATEPVLDGDGDMPPGLVDQRARAAARMLAHLQAVDIDDAGLGREQVLTVGDELARWAKTMSVVDQSLVVGADDLRRALEASLPEEVPARIVHGDYRLGNILFDGGEPTAIIDWEIWSLTDPRVDLTWFLLSCDHLDFPGVGTIAPGMPSEAELIAEYGAAGGLTADIPWFMAFSRFKMAAIMAHNLRRHREGRHHDPFQERLPPTIASLVDRGRKTMGAVRSTS